MILPFSQKLKKFRDPVMYKQMSVVDHSFRPQKKKKKATDIRNTFKAHMNGPAAVLL